MKFLILFIIMCFGVSSNAQEFKFKKKIGKYVFKKSNGKFDESLTVDEYVKVVDGCRKIRIGSNWGMINYDGKVIIKPIYQEVQKFVNDGSIVKIEGKYGVLMKSGSYKLKPIYDRIDYSNEHESLVQLNGKWGSLMNGEFITVDKSIVFRNPDIKPILLKCIDKDDECTSKTMMTEFFGKVPYPKSAVDNGIEGTIVAELIIGESGKLEEIIVLKSVGGGLDEVTIETLKSLFSEWKPGVQGGVNVKSRILFPAKFRLE